MRIVYFIIIFLFVCNYAKNQGLANSLANISHENLLDNPWFTVNQRGLSNFVATQYGVDRWKFNADNTPTIEFTNNGIEISDYVSGNIVLYQPLESDLIDSYKDYTISIMVSDGSILSSKLNTTGSLSFIGELAGAHFFHQIAEVSGLPELEIFVNALTTDITIRAIKLELGSVSTLAMDTAPNYATELLKCQRYFYRHKGAYMYSGYFNSSTTFRSNLKLPTAMRAIPAITFPDGIDYTQCGIYSAQGDFIQPTALAVDNVNNVVGIPELLINSSVSSQSLYVTGVQRFNIIMDISADL